MSIKRSRCITCFQMKPLKFDEYALCVGCWRSLFARTSTTTGAQIGLLLAKARRVRNGK